VHLDTIPGHIALRASATKSKRADSLPLHPQIADALRQWRPANPAADCRVVATVPNMKCLRADLALAGIADEDDAGRYVDFHSLRVSLSTLLAANKVSPRTAQALMRHSDPRLTANTYTDERVLPLAVELQTVPSIPVRPTAVAVDRKSDAKVQALLAELTADQKRSLLEALSRAVAV